MSTKQSVGVELDFRNKVPITLQIVEAIQRQVAAGKLHPGDQLPTVRQMAADLRVNFNTVARAYRRLDEVGVISTQQGRGTYVLEEIPPEKSRRLRLAALDGLTRSYLAATFRLGYQPDEVQRRMEIWLARWMKTGEVPEE